MKLPKSVGIVHLAYSPINQAYFILFGSQLLNAQVLSIHNEKAEAIDKFEFITRTGKYAEEVQG